MIAPKDLSPPADLAPIRRVLISVFDKSGVVDFARRLAKLNIEIISTGGTARAISEAGIPVKDVSEITNFPEMLDGRVKTLHPLVHGGILSRRNDPDDKKQLEDQGAVEIDMVVVNLYPFSKATAGADVTDAVAIENIDIGGPTMIRAAAKNFFFTSVVTNPSEYDEIAVELESQNGCLTMFRRQNLAHSAFRHTAAYDAAIDGYFSKTEENKLPETLNKSFEQAQILRYGENPHQPAALYGNPTERYEQLHGKALSYNNIIDLTAAFNLIDEFKDAPATCAILKHTNPCGVGQADSLLQAWENAFATDRQSPFGGIIIVNRPLDLPTAEAINSIFTEIIIAPDFEAGVLDLLMKKKNRRLIKSLPNLNDHQSEIAVEVKTVTGGLLAQHTDPTILKEEEMEWKVVTERQPTDQEMAAMQFAWRVSKHVKSNAIVYAGGSDQGSATLGVGAGQMSRIDASEVAVMKSKKSGLSLQDSVVASDAFFPFADGLLAAADAGAIAAIQPGGSIRDQEVIDAANERGMTMIFTGKRHFRH